MTAAIRRPTAPKTMCARSLPGCLPPCATRCPEGGGVAYAVGNRLKKAAAFRVVDAEHEA